MSNEPQTDEAEAPTPEEASSETEREAGSGETEAATETFPPYGAHDHVRNCGCGYPYRPADSES